MSFISPWNPVIGNVTSAPPHVTDFQAFKKGFGKKYYPLMNLRRGGFRRHKRSFSESLEMFRNLQEASKIKPTKKVKPKPDPEPYLPRIQYGDEGVSFMNRIGTFGDGIYMNA